MISSCLFIGELTLTVFDKITKIRDGPRKSQWRLRKTPMPTLEVVISYFKHYLLLHNVT